MSNKDLRTCCVCHVQYPYCPICHKDLPTWMFSYCSENCREIYKITVSYEDGKIDAKKANDQLSNLDLSKNENFGESYKNTLKKIHTEIKKVQNEEKNITDKRIVNSVNDSKVLKNPVKKKGFNDVE